MYRLCKPFKFCHGRRGSRHLRLPKGLINVKLPNQRVEKEVFEEHSEGYYCQWSGDYKLAHSTESAFLPLLEDWGVDNCSGPGSNHEAEGSRRRKNR